MDVRTELMRSKWREPRISLWDLFRYYTSQGLTWRLIAEVSRYRPAFPLRFTARLLRLAISGDLFVRRPNAEAFLKGLQWRGGLVLVNSSWEDLSLLLRARDASEYGFIGLSYCQLPHLKPPPQSWDEPLKISPSELLRLAEPVQLRELLMRLATELELEVYLLTTTLSSLQVVLDRLRRGADVIPFIGFTCPMMTRIVYELADMIGLRGVIAPLSDGVCRSMLAFDLAERGGKVNVTSSTPSAIESLIELLSNVLSEDIGDRTAERRVRA